MPPAARLARSVTWRTGWSCCARTSPQRTLLTRAPSASGSDPAEAPRARSLNQDQSLPSSTWAETDAPTDRPATWGKNRPRHPENTTSRELCKCMKMSHNECFKKLSQIQASLLWCLWALDALCLCLHVIRRHLSSCQSALKGNASVLFVDKMLGEF